MKFTLLLFSPILVFISCTNHTPANNHTSKDSLEQDSTIQTTVADSARKFTVDGYGVTNDMFGSSNNGREIKMGGVRSLDKVWFVNNKLKQALVFELATDEFRTITFHFYTNDIPGQLIKTIGLYNGEGEPVSDEQKKKNFKGFINLAKNIDETYFTTNKGIQLGMSKQRATGIYGKPTNISKDGDIEMYEWEFTGDLIYDGKTDLHGRPLAKDSYGHKTTMFFRDDKLVAVILNNDIP